MGTIELPPLPSPDTNFNFSAVSLMEGGAGGEKVPLVTLDSLELTKCSMVKIDVEGMESLVLAGAKRLIEKCRPVIYVENNDQEPRAARQDAAGDRLCRLLVDPSLLRRAEFLLQHRRRLAERGVGLQPDLRAEEREPLGAQPFLGAEDNWHACVQRMQTK